MQSKPMAASYKVGGMGRPTRPLQGPVQKKANANSNIPSAATSSKAGYNSKGYQQNSNYSGVVNLGKASRSNSGQYGQGKQYLEADDDENGHERPPSPREIAAKFEKYSKDMGGYAVGARNSPSPNSAGGYLKHAGGGYAGAGPKNKGLLFWNT